jgi:hypothetical protein
VPKSVDFHLNLAKNVSSANKNASLFPETAVPKNLDFPKNASS